MNLCLIRKFRKMPESGKLRICRAFHRPGRFGTVPAEGERILVIIAESRNHGFRMTIITDDGVIVIDIP